MKGLFLLQGGSAVGIFVCHRRLSSPSRSGVKSFSDKDEEIYFSDLDNADRPQGVTITRNDRGQQQAGKTASSPPQL